MNLIVEYYSTRSWA